MRAIERRWSGDGRSGAGTAHTAGAIPVVDIQALRDGRNPQAVADALHAASQDPGFIYISGHGIPDAVIDAARACALDFFRHTEADKSAVSISREHRGWLRRGAAKMQDGRDADLKESFVWGHEDAAGKPPADHPLRGANRWPAFMPKMRAAAMAYYHHAHRVAVELMRGFALGLGLERGFFLRHCSRPLSRASFVYYPPQNGENGNRSFGVGPHTDFGVLTVLCQDRVGGLQVQSAGGEWMAAAPVAGTLVVNVGDLLARWTDGAYRSTPHRVINRSGKERLSLVLAFDPDPETAIDAREVFGADYRPGEAPISCGDYLLWRFGRAFAYRNREARA